MSIMTPAAPRNQVAAPRNVAVQELQDRLRDTQSSVVRHRLTAGLLWMGLGLILAMAIAATADYFAEIATPWRAFWLTGVLTVLTIAGVRGWRRSIAPYTLSRAAADAEVLMAQFGQRLRTTLDYEQQVPRPAEASGSLLSALQKDTWRMAQKTNWNDVVDARPVFVAFTASALVALCVSIPLLGSGDFRIAAGRALLLPLDYTTVTYSPQTQTVRIGESAEIKAEVAGRPVASAQLRYRAAGSQEEWQTIDLAPTEEVANDAQTDPATGLHGELSATLNELEHDLEFEVVAGPRPLPAGLIQVLQPLTLENVESRIIPPAYTGRKSEAGKGLDLKVLEGSTVELQLELNRPAAEARLTRRDTGAAAKNASDEKSSGTVAADTAEWAEAPLVIDGSTIRGTLTDLRKGASFTISAKAADGMELEPQRLSIRVQLDRKPEVKFIEPPEELVVTPTTEVPMIVEAGDDIGLLKVGILYQVGAGEMQTLWEQDGEGSDEPLRISPVLMLEDLNVNYKTAITYYAFAEDNYFGQPRRTTTPLRYIDIRPYQTAFQVCEGGSCCNGASLTLEELITRQRHNLSLSFAAQDQDPPAKSMLARLTTAQSELLEATREFEEGMRERAGLIPPLARAVEDMEQAVAAFEAERLPPAIIAEQEALADLIRTRENVRQKLSQSSQCASACRKFDRQQRQKLRMPEKKKPQDQQQQVADLRQKLEDLAKRERKWSEECKQCSSNSSSSKSGSSQKPSSQAQSPSENQKPASEKPGDQQKDDSQKQDPKDGSSEGKEGDAKDQQEAKAPSPAEIAAAQEKMRAELAELRERLEKLKAAGQAAQEQARQADESMEQGLEELKKQDGERAAKEGERSADQLEKLSEHLAAMNARDFGQRLDQAQKLARQLASREEALEKKLGGKSSPKNGQNPSPGSEGDDASGGDQPERNGEKSSSPKGDKEGNSPSGQSGEKSGGKDLAREQRALAGETDLLADQLEALEHDAAGERAGMKGKLAAIQAENPPRDIAGLMRQAADDLQSKRDAQAGRGAAQSRERLDELSRSLAEVRGDYAQPQLEELVALEEQLAKLMEAARRDKENGGELSAAKQKWDDLKERLDALAAGDKRLAQALRELGEAETGKAQAAKPGATQTGTTPPKPGDRLKPAPVEANSGQEMPPGHYSWLELGDFTGIREVAKALQAKIQEAILAGALMDSDQPVPPEYRDLVEKYYRALSDDLR